MSPTTHLLASWIVAAWTTDNLRDRRLVTLAGVAPDLDGLGIILDVAHGSLRTGQYYYYPQYHHWLTHGLPAALACSVLLAALARRRWKVLVLSLLTYHLHLLCDLVGSRGPTPADLWPIFYFGPLSQHPMWMWRHQWPLDGWQNRLIGVILVFWALSLAVKKGDSPLGVFNRRWDYVFVGVLRKWRANLCSWTAKKSAPGPLV
jgi:hypothetical protein